MRLDSRRGALAIALATAIATAIASVAGPAIAPAATPDVAVAAARGADKARATRTGTLTEPSGWQCRARVIARDRWTCRDLIRR